MYLVATSASNVQVKVTIKQCELIHTFQRPKYDELSCIAIVFVWKCHIVIASLKISAQSCPTMVFVSALLHSLWVFVYLGILVRSRQAPGDEIQDNIRQHGQSDTHTHRNGEMVVSECSVLHPTANCFYSYCFSDFDKEFWAGFEHPPHFAEALSFLVEVDEMIHASMLGEGFERHVTDQCDVLRVFSEIRGTWQPYFILIFAGLLGRELVRTRPDYVSSCGSVR